MHATNIHGMSKRKWAEMDSLFIKFQGPNQKFLKDYIALAKEVTKKHGALGFDTAKDDLEASDLWNDRKNGHYAGLALIPGCRAVATDVWCVLDSPNITQFCLNTPLSSVPVSSLPKLVYDTKEDLISTGITGVVVGHVGDGMYYVLAHSSLLSYHCA